MIILLLLLLLIILIGKIVKKLFIIVKIRIGFNINSNKIDEVALRLKIKVFMITCFYFINFFFSKSLYYYFINIFFIKQ